MVTKKHPTSLLIFNKRISIYLFIAALILMSFIAGMDIVYLKGFLSISLIGIVIGLFLMRSVPELPFMLLAVGMSFWDLVGQVIPISGLAIMLTLGLIAGMAAITSFSNKLTSHSLKISSVDVYLLAFTLWAWLSLFWSSNTVYGSFKLQGFIAYSVIAYFFVRIYFSSAIFSLKRISALMLVAGIGHALLALNAAWVTGIFRPDVLGMRYYLVYQIWGRGPIHESEMLAFGLLGTVILFQLYRKQYRYILGALFAFQLWALMGYQQRSVTISLVIGLCAFFVLSMPSRTLPGRNTILKTFVALIAAAGLAALFLRFNPQFALDYLVEDNNVLQRLNYFSLGWQAFLANPVVGVGIGGMGNALGSVIDDFYVHNRILEIAAELGIIGLILATLLTVSFIKYTKFMYRAKDLDYTLRNLSALAAACLIMRYVTGMSSGDLVGWQLGIWAGILVASVDLLQRTKFQNQKFEIQHQPIGRSILYFNQETKKIETQFTPVKRT